MLKISIDEIKLKIPPKKTVLSGINFNIPENTIYTIAGKNGSGKSTLLKAIPRLLDERFYSVTGRIDYNSTEVLSLNNIELVSLRKTKIRYVMQDAINSFDHLRKFKYYFEKISTPMDEIEAELEYFMLPPAAKLFKLYPYEVSGGMAQRISLVLAILTHPEVILLDEPTSGIDSPAANLFLLRLKDFVSQKNNCCLLVTHDMKFARKAGDNIAILADGKLRELSSAQELINNNLLQDYLNQEPS